MKKIFKTIKKEVSQLIFSIIQSYPDTTRGARLRKNYWSKRLRSCGTNSEFRRGCAIGFPNLIDVGNNFIIGHDALMTAGHSQGIFIGNDVSLSRGTFVHAANHNIDNINIPIMKQGVSSAKIEFNNKIYSIVIEDDVWMGSKCIILSGTHLKKGCVISAGSVISGKYEPYSIIAGNPGRVIKKRI
jgi:acetyltransferase-like isoleucine patch superfamily enzyme